MTADNGPPVPEDYLFRVMDAIDEVAKETGKSVPQIAINWLLQRPTVSNVIIGARNEEQLKQNLGSVGWKLTPGANGQARCRQQASPRPIPTGTRKNSSSAIPCRSESRAPIQSIEFRHSGRKPRGPHSDG